MSDPAGAGKTETHKIDGENLVSRLTFGVVGAVLMPVWVAVGAIAALAAQYTIVVVKEEKS
jgi:hypothetical protein